MSEFVLMACGECGIEFHLPQHFYNERKETGNNWYCPNGHCRVFKEADSVKYRREAERLRQQIAQKDDEIAEQKRKVAAARGETTKIKKRINNGVCPCCNRTFTNLHRHMTTQHPDFGDNVVPIKTGTAA